MAPRTAAALCTLLPPSRAWLRRCYSSTAADTLQFSCLYPIGTQIQHEKLVNKLKGHHSLANPHQHDAAVVLATPDLARQMVDRTFTRDLVSVVAGSDAINRFTLLGAVVDQLPPARGSNRCSSGISVVRGHVNNLMPHIALPETSSVQKPLEADAVSSLTFHLGWPSVTLPLARTTFLNQRHSTLVASSWDTAKAGQPPSLVDIVDRTWLRVFLPRPEETTAQTMADINLWSPLLPITAPRKVTESLGNIIRGIDIDGETSPASTELEAAVDSVFGQIASSGADAGPIGVWAAIRPPISSPPKSRAPAVWEGDSDILEASEVTIASLKDLYKHGGRLFKILSGGGGWGAKKGLLSLDPQETHFQLSEEEEMERFIKTMADSSFAPAGSTIQFFASPPAPPSLTVHARSPLFGVSGPSGPAQETTSLHDGELVLDHFGAMASQGVFLESPLDKATGTGVLVNTKLTVPQSLVYVSR